jgi:hypothetical protein
VEQGIRLRHGLLLAALLVTALLLAGCGSASSGDPTVGTAYAGPAALVLRKDLGAHAPAVATVHHGDRLDVVDTHRRFVKVRTSAGVEGWTDATLLLSQQQMDDLRRLAQSAAKLPSEGAATAFDPLNVHVEPYRQSPSFYQIPEGGTVDVIGHRVTPRIRPPQPVPKASMFRRTASRKTGAKENPSGAVRFPLPAPPKPPANWIDLSRPRVSDLPGYQPPPPPASTASASDDWNLVRTRDGRTGWALSRMLYMAIPDEVAQYAEGHRITAYLPLGEVHDRRSGDKQVNGKPGSDTKFNWLWTTASANVEPYEFDSFRVFVWSIKHHRYETAYIERNVKGHFPVETETLPGQDQKAFSLIVEDDAGQLCKQTYAFSGFRVRRISSVPYQPPPPLPEVHDGGGFSTPAPPPPSSRGWRERFQSWFKHGRRK